MKSLKRKLKRVRPLLGTYVEITLLGSAPDEQLNTWITAGFEAVEEIDLLMSRYRPDSDLSRLNGSIPGQWIEVHPHTAKILKASNALWRASNGIFDIRCSSFPAATGRESIRPDGPPTETLGGDSIKRVRKTGPWTFDLGGIAKGYAVDYAVEKIKSLSRGRQVSGVVNAGGDLRRWGPGAPAMALATSAVRTPASSERLSSADFVIMPAGTLLTEPKAVSVLSPRCLWSDALTKVMLLAPSAIAKRCLAQYKAQALSL